jgi:ATP-dependent Lon protease
LVKAPEVIESDAETDAFRRHVHQLTQEVVGMSPIIQDEVAEVLSQINDSLQLAYALAYNSSLDTASRQGILEKESAKEKLSGLARPLTRGKEGLAIGNRIQAERELERFSQMLPQSAEYSLIRTYLAGGMTSPW